MTDPEEASEFVDQTNVDCLAIAIGTSHGAYKFTKPPTGEVLAIKRIKDIHAKTNCAGFNGIFSYAGMGSEMAQRNMKLFADAVLPEIRQLGSTPLFDREIISEPEFVSARHRAA